MKQHLSSWVEHVKAYAQQHNLKYSQALKDQNCRTTYKNRNSNSTPQKTNDSNQINLSEPKAKRKYTKKKYAYWGISSN